MIVSYIPGRVRLRAAALKNPETMQAVLEMAQGFEGVFSAEPNPRSGSLLVLYDPALIDEAMLQAATAFADHFGTEEAGADGHGLPRRPQNGRVELSLLLGTLGLTVASLALGKGAHAALGGLFCLLSAKHVYERRQRMF